jgi:cysteine desulfurase
MRKIYMDYAATTPTHPDVLKEMSSYFTTAFGNPSSIYSYGREAKKAIEKSRIKVAELIGANKEEIYFTSGGTESDNLAIKGITDSCENKKKHIIISPIEHHAVLETCKYLANNGFSITYLHVNKYGMVDPDEVKKTITKNTVLVSIMHANNEVGTIQPISEISRITQEANIVFHTDAVQTVGHIPINVNELGVNLLSISSHKLYGPKGVGALYIKKGTKISSLIHGGGQEQGIRSGTEFVPGIIGFAKAIEITRVSITKEAERLKILRNKLIEGILENIDESFLNGHPTKRLPNNVNITINSISGESMVHHLDLRGICISTGSACSSGKTTISHVLTAMGLSPDQTQCSLRFTLGMWTTEEEIQFVLNVLPKIVNKIAKISN